MSTLSSYYEFFLKDLNPILTALRKGVIPSVKHRVGIKEDKRSEEAIIKYTFCDIDLFELEKFAEKSFFDHAIFYAELYKMVDMLGKRFFASRTPKEERPSNSITVQQIQKILDLLVFIPKECDNSKSIYYVTSRDLRRLELLELNKIFAKNSSSPFTFERASDSGIVKILMRLFHDTINRIDNNEKMKLASANTGRT